MNQTIAITLILIFLACVWLFLKNKKKQKRREKSTSNKNSEKLMDFHWPGNEKFEFEVVGESHYQESIKELIENDPENYSSMRFTAHLVLEDKNKYDPKAVAVFINNKKVGHLSRDNARSFRRRLGQKNLTGVNTTCDALIFGYGKAKGGKPYMYGVKLDIKPFN